MHCYKAMSVRCLIYVPLRKRCYTHRRMVCSFAMSLARPPRQDSGNVQDAAMKMKRKEGFKWHSRSACRGFVSCEAPPVEAMAPTDLPRSMA